MRDFRQDKTRDAACKNAYALLGQHRHELAAAFFVLGECSLSCTNNDSQAHEAVHAVCLVAAEV